MINFEEIQINEIKDFDKESPLLECTTSARGDLPSHSLLCYNTFITVDCEHVNDRI